MELGLKMFLRDWTGGLTRRCEGVGYGLNNGRELESNDLEAEAKLEGDLNLVPSRSWTDCRVENCIDEEEEQKTRLVLLGLLVLRRLRDLAEDALERPPSDVMPQQLAGQTLRW